MTEKRAEERRFLVRPIVAYPVAEDGVPDIDRPLQGHSEDLSRHGLRIDLEGAVRDCPTFCVGVEIEPGSMGFADLDIHHSQAENGHRTFGGVLRDVLPSSRAAPTLDFDGMAFDYPLPRAALARLDQAGIARRKLVDRVLVCPRCQALPTFRQGCRRCGSGRVATRRFIHHFACGHYGDAAAFETERGIVCPRCRLRHLVVGSDFEFAEGSHRCADCGLEDSRFELVGHCLKCGHRFPAHEGIEQEIHVYEVARLDPARLLGDGVS